MQVRLMGTQPESMSAWPVLLQDTALSCLRRKSQLQLALVPELLHPRSPEERFLLASVSLGPLAELATSIQSQATFLAWPCPALTSSHNPHALGMCPFILVHHPSFPAPPPHARLRMAAAALCPAPGLCLPATGFSRALAHFITACPGCWAPGQGSGRGTPEVTGSGSWLGRVEAVSPWIGVQVCCDPLAACLAER